MTSIEVVAVTAASHPQLFAALETVSHDCGRRAGHDAHAVRADMANTLSAIEDALGGLDEDELTTLACGEEDEALALAARTPALGQAHALITSFFEETMHRVPPQTTERRSR